MKYKLALVLLLFCCHCFSDEIRFGFGIGEGDVDLSSEFNVNDNDAGDHTVSGYLYAGYIFENGVLFDLQYSSLTDDVLFGTLDNLHLNSYEALVGYRFKFDRFYVEPKIGYAKWNLDLKEGAFLNPGPEQKSKDSGSDPLLSLSVGYQFSDIFGLSLLYKYLDFEHGNAESYNFGFDFKI